MTQKEINTAEWQDENNWRGGWLGIYSSPRDTRIWVPKRNPAYGLTLNLAHRAGQLWLAAMLGFPILIIIIVALVT
jgi:uncharacterized membrane protein